MGILHHFRYLPAAQATEPAVKQGTHRPPGVFLRRNVGKTQPVEPVALAAQGVVPGCQNVALLMGFRRRTGKMGNAGVSRGVHHGAGADLLPAGDAFHDDRMNAVFPRLRVCGVAAVENLHPRLNQLLLGQNGKEPGAIAHTEAVILLRPPRRVCPIQPIGRVFILRAHGNGQTKQLLRQSEGNLMTDAVAQRKVIGNQSRRSQAA